MLSGRGHALSSLIPEEVHPDNLVCMCNPDIVGIMVRGTGPASLLALF